MFLVFRTLRTLYKPVSFIIKCVSFMNILNTYTFFNVLIILVALRLQSYKSRFFRISGSIKENKRIININRTFINRTPDKIK